MQISGVVQDVTSRECVNRNPRPGQNPNFTMYSILLNDGEYYGAGSRQPPCVPGQNVSFFMRKNGDYKNIVKDTLELLEGEVTTPPVMAPATSSPSKPKEDWNARTQYWNDKEANDKKMEPEYRRRSACTAALAFLKLAQDAEALPISKATQTSPAKKFDAMRELLSTITHEFEMSFLSAKEGYLAADRVPGEDDEDLNDEFPDV